MSTEEGATTTDYEMSSTMTIPPTASSLPLPSPPKSSRVYYNQAGEALSSRYEDPLRQESRRKNRASKKESKRAAVASLLRRLLLPLAHVRGGDLAAAHAPLLQVLSEVGSSRPMPVDWGALPPSLGLTHEALDNSGRPRPPKAKDAARLARKRRQVEAFSLFLAALSLPPGSTVVDFASGSSGLTLPLAFLYPHLLFVAVDLKLAALTLLSSRALAAGVRNVSTSCVEVGSYSRPYALALALHACGQASDAAIKSAVGRRAPYLVAPCCVGKVKFSLGTARPNIVRRREDGALRHFAWAASPATTAA